MTLRVPGGKKRKKNTDNRTEDSEVLSSSDHFQDKSFWLSLRPRPTRHKDVEFDRKCALCNDSSAHKVKDGILPHGIMTSSEELLKAKHQSLLMLKDENELRETIYDLLRTIKDPEKPQTLEELDVVYEDCVRIEKPTPKGIAVIRIEFNPTVPHCSLATLIGLCIRVKLERHLVALFKLDIYIKEGAHATETEINKQINDKERIAAAMENPNLRELVEKCIQEEE